MILLEFLLSSFALSFLLGVTGFWLFNRWALKQAKIEADAIIQDSKAELEIVELDLQEKTQELEQSIFGPHEKAIAAAQERIEELQSEVEDKISSNQNQKEKLNQLYRKQQSQVDSFDHKVKEEKKQIKDLKTKKTSLFESFRQALQTKLGANLEHEIEKLAQLEIQDWTTYYNKWVHESEANTQDQLEWLAKKIINRALLRFHRPYSSERGIPYVHLDPDRRNGIEKLKAQNNKAIQIISSITGCDILMNEEQGHIAVGGFDPVRREFARRVLEKALREKSELTETRIQQFSEAIKKELFAHIKRDGDLLCKELSLQNVSIEIRKMMGSLRYRYSFTQNQYFHCGEVGWLAGIIASEMGGVDPRKAKRAGMLHDLGKAMDHEFDGGHAVIGANFIEKHGEAPDIIHAVRAHHYDETPSTPLAYLVITSDAISGARPGARRSTVESYNQKINDLENIAYSFQGVSDCIILNGGRECRLKVDSHKIDDAHASELAKLVTNRIEAECTYPGQIKVVVVRETVSTESKSQRSPHQK